MTIKQCISYIDELTKDHRWTILHNDFISISFTQGYDPFYLDNFEKTITILNDNSIPYTVNEEVLFHILESKSIYVNSSDIISKLINDKINEIIDG